MGESDLELVKGQGGAVGPDPADGLSGASLHDGELTVVDAAGDGLLVIGGELAKELLETKVVDSEQRIIEGYAATWDEDQEGETFDRAAFDSSLARYMQRPVLLYQHGTNRKYGRQPIGKVLKAWVDGVGLRVRAQLYKGDEAADAVWNLIKQGVRHFSVGALARAVRKMGSHILEWPLVEISVEPFAANPSARFEIVKALELEYAKALGLDPSEWGIEQAAGGAEQQLEELAEDSAEGGSLAGVQSDLSNGSGQTTEERKAMSEDIKVEVPQLNEKVIAGMVGKAVADALAAERAAQAQAAEDAKAEAKRIDDLVQAGVTKALAEQRVNRKIGFGSELELKGTSLDWMRHPYDDVPTPQMALGYLVLKAAGADISPKFYQGMTGKAMAEAKAGKLLTKSTDDLFFRAAKDFETYQLLTKADELMGSDVASAGDEWVPVYYSRELIPLIRNEAKVLGLFRQVEVPGESMTFPIQTGSATWYKTAQMDDAADLSWATATNTGRVAKPGTSNMTLTPGKISALTAWTGELDEQSLVPMLPFLQQEFMTSGREVMDELIISGDETTANTNISDTGNGSISALWRLLTLDGLRHYALITDSTNSRDAGVMTADDFLATKKLMGTNGAYALDPAKLAWLLDAGIYWKMQSLGEAITLDKFGAGVLERVFGSPVIVSDQYGATDTAGKIHNTTGNNVLGSFMCVRPDQGMVGFGRRLKIEVERKAMADASYIVAHMSIDFALATDEAVALSYNVTV